MAVGYQVPPGTRTAEARRPSLVDVAKTAAEDLLDLFVSQIRLARVELAADARGALKRVARVGLFVPPLAVGYAFIMGSAAAALAGPLGWPLALLAVGGVQLAVGVVGIAVAVRGFARMTLLDRTTAEVTNSVHSTVVAASPMKPKLSAAQLATARLDERKTHV